MWADNSPQSDSCLGLLRSDAGCRRFSAFPDAFFLNIFFFSRGGLFSASLWVSRSWPGTSFSQKKCLVCSRKALIHNKGFEWKNSHLALLKYKLRELFFFVIFPQFVNVFSCFFSIGNHSDREEPSVWGMEESTSTCLYGVLLLQRDQSRGVPGRREGSC